MKIIHTSDWHLGIELQNFSRINEQISFLDEFVNIVKEKDVDLVIIAGDIFDNYTPPSWAQRAFNETLKKLSDNSKRAIVVIAGNHDSPERLESIYPLAQEFGVLIFGTPKSKVNKVKYSGFEIIDSKESYVEIKIKDEIIKLIALPYPSEKRLEEVFINKETEKENQKEYSKKIGSFIDNLSKNFSSDSINILTSHFYIKNGKTSDSERDISIGGTYAVEIEDLPNNIDYIALGHLHNNQNISNAYYSGSPIQYSKSEAGNAKFINLIEAHLGKDIKVEKIPLKIKKPIVALTANSIQEAIKICELEANRESWLYLTIKTDSPLETHHIKELKTIKKDIVEIIPVIKNSSDDEDEPDEPKEYSPTDIIKGYYKTYNKGEPSKEVIEEFVKLVQEVENEA